MTFYGVPVQTITSHMCGDCVTVTNSDPVPLWEIPPSAWIGIPRRQPTAAVAWAQLWDEFVEWVESLEPLAVAGPAPPWQGSIVPRVETVVRRGHPNPHRARWE